MWNKQLKQVVIWALIFLPLWTAVCLTIRYMCADYHWLIRFFIYLFAGLVFNMMVERYIKWYRNRGPKVYKIHSMNEDHPRWGK